MAWRWEGLVIVRTTGVGGTIIASDQIDAFAVSSSNAERFETVQGASAAIDTTISNTLDVTMKWASAVAGAKWAVEECHISRVI